MDSSKQLRTQLYDLEAARCAHFSLYNTWEIAEHFGNPRQEYEAIRREVGVLDLGYLGKLRVLGRDRVKYLHNMVSNDIKNLPAGKGCYATLLTHQGRIESDLYVYAFAEELWLECSPAGRGRLLGSLNKFIIADVVKVEDWSDQIGLLSLQGPRSAEKMEKVVGLSLDALGPLEHRTLERSAGTWIVVRRDRTGCDGFDLWLPSPDVAAVWRRWTEADEILPVGHEALNWLRTEAGIPWYGVDMGEKSLPMEMGLDHAISMSKGCYRGQEIVARVVHRGHLDRRLGAVVVQASEPPANGTEVRADGLRIGEVTSAILSPRLGKPLGLAILKTSFLKPGTPVEIVAGERVFPGEVVSLPLK